MRQTLPRAQETALGNPFGGPQWDREESRRGFAGPLGSRRLAKMSKKIRVIPFWTDHLARLLIGRLWPPRVPETVLLRASIQFLQMVGIIGPA